jgi:hypothetical protein
MHNNVILTTRNVVAQFLNIIGPAAFCHVGKFRTQSGQSVSWSVTPSSATGPSTVVTSNMPYVEHGTIWAWANGVNVGMEFVMCPDYGMSYPSTMYWDVGCRTHIILELPLEDHPWDRYRWVAINSYGANFSFYPCCTYQRSVDVYFHVDGAWAHIAAYKSDGTNDYYAPSFVYHVINSCGQPSPEVFTIGGSGLSDMFSVTDKANMPVMPEMPIKVFPNPTSGVLNIDLKDLLNRLETNSTRDAGALFDIRLYDRMGNLQRQTFTLSDNAQFNVYSLPVGMYFLHVYDGVSIAPYIQQVVVER